MSASIKPVQIRIRITPENEVILKRLAGNVLSITDVATYLLDAAVQCVDQNPGRVSFPPKFEVAQLGRHYESENPPVKPRK